MYFNFGLELVFVVVCEIEVEEVLVFFDGDILVGDCGFCDGGIVDLGDDLDVVVDYGLDGDFVGLCVVGVGGKVFDYDYVLVGVVKCGCGWDGDFEGYDVCFVWSEFGLVFVEFDLGGVGVCELFGFVVYVCVCI